MPKIPRKRRSLDRSHLSLCPPAWRVRVIASRLLLAARKTRMLGTSCVVLSISCVGKREMARLNKKYRKRAGPTDILSFEQKGRGPKGWRFLGDLVLCPEVARAQAREFGHSPAVEAVVLIAHGFLHLIGYDHERSDLDAARMRRAEARLLKTARLGVQAQKAGLMARSAVGKRHG